MHSSHTNNQLLVWRNEQICWWRCRDLMTSHFVVNEHRAHGTTAAEPTTMYVWINVSIITICTCKPMSIEMYILPSYVCSNGTHNNYGMLTTFCNNMSLKRCPTASCSAVYGMWMCAVVWAAQSWLEAIRLAVCTNRRSIGVATIHPVTWDWYPWNALLPPYYYSTTPGAKAGFDTLYIFSWEQGVRWTRAPVQPFKV
jgi:hypothetical protein